MTSPAYASKQVRGDVRDDRPTLSRSALPTTPPDYAIPLPIRKYTTTNPNTLSPTYHLLYDLTQPPSPPSSIPVDSPWYNTNPQSPGARTSFLGPLHHRRDMKRSTESGRVTLKDGPCAQFHLKGSDMNRINEPISDNLIESFTKGNKEIILPNEKILSNGADGCNNFNVSRSHVSGAKHQQTEVNKGSSEVDTRADNRGVWTESTTDISASFIQPRKTAGSVLSTPSGTDERGTSTSTGFNERGVGFPLSPYCPGVTDRLDSWDVLQYNQVTGNSALHNASGNAAQLVDTVTKVSVQNVFFSTSENLVVCDNSPESYDIQSSSGIHSEHSAQGKHSNLQKRAIFKCEGDSVRLFLVNDDKEFNDDSGVASDNETSPFTETFQGKNNVENRKQSLGNLSKLPSFLRASLRGKSKKNKNKHSLSGSATTTSAPNLIQINNFSTNRSNKNQLNRWHNLQLNSLVPGNSDTPSQQRVTTKGESTPHPPAYGRVINKSSTVSRDPSFHPSADGKGRSGKEPLDSGDVTRPSEIKGILVNKENVSREKIGHVHKGNTVQFIDHSGLSHSHPTDQSRYVSSKAGGSNKEVIDRSKYIIKPREIVDGVSLDSYSNEGSNQSWPSGDGRQHINDQSVKRPFIPQDSLSSGVSGQNWPREHFASTTHGGHSLDNVNFTESPFGTTQAVSSRSVDLPETHRAHTCTQPCILCSNVDIYPSRNQQTVIAAADPGSDNYFKLWDTSRGVVGRDNKKITPRQKFERRHNRSQDKPDARISSSGHEVRLNGPNKASLSSSQLYDHKESPRAKFERDRAARAHAITSGGHSSTHTAHLSDSDHRTVSNQFSDQSDNLSETSAPPPLPPRVRYLSDSTEKSAPVDINSNIVTKCDSCEVNSDIKGVNSQSVLESKSQFSNHEHSFVSTELVRKRSNATVEQTTEGFLHSERRSVNPLNTDIQQSNSTSSQNSTDLCTPVIHHQFNVSDIVSQNEYIRQVLNQTTDQQIRLLFGPELHEDLASLTSQNSSHCENWASVETHIPSENLHKNYATVAISDNPLSPSFVDSFHSTSTRQNNRSILLKNSDSQTEVDVQKDLTKQSSESETRTSVLGNAILAGIVGANDAPNAPTRTSNNSLTHNSSTLSESNKLFQTNLKSLILTQEEAEMLAAKGIRIYDSVDDYVAMVKSPLQKSTSAPQFIWEGSTYIIVPTVLEHQRAPVGASIAPKSNNKNMMDFMTHRSISDSGTDCPADSDQATYITMTSPLEKRLNANHRAMSVEVLCTDGSKAFTGLPAGGAPGAEITEPGYVEWRTCSGWAGKSDLKPTAENRNSRGYVDWDTIWTPATALKSSNKDDEHVYDVIGDDSNLHTFHAKVAEQKDNVEAVDAPPALPERTYINRLRQKVTSTDGQVSPGLSEPRSLSPRHAHSGYHCHPTSRRHHHHHNHHHQHHHQHRHHHSQPPSKPLNKPPPPPPNTQPYTRASSLSPPTPLAQQESHEFLSDSYNYAEVNKLKGYTFSNLMQSPDMPPKPHRPDPSAVSSENYCRLAPVTSADSMASWESGDVLDFIDGLHDSMSAKRRENIYILLSNKKTRAKFSESLEIESRLLSRGLILNSSFLNGTERTTGDMGRGGGFTQPGLVKRKGAIAPVSSTYV